MDTSYVYEKEMLGNSIAFDSEKILSRQASGSEKIILWDKMTSIKIITTNQGPYKNDVFWVIESKNDRIVFSMGTEGEEAFLSKAQKLEGFNNKVFIDAMSCADNNEFYCWQKLDLI